MGTPRYTEEFKVEAVRQVLDRGYTGVGGYTAAGHQLVQLESGDQALAAVSRRAAGAGV